MNIQKSVMGRVLIAIRVGSTNWKTISYRHTYTMHNKYRDKNSIYLFIFKGKSHMLCAVEMFVVTETFTGSWSFVRIVTHSNSM